MTPNAIVRAATGLAWAAANDNSVTVPIAGQRARLALYALPGMGGTGALARAVLLACAPDRMAVADRRVGVSLNTLGRHISSGDGFYQRYLEQACDLAFQMQHGTAGPVQLKPRHVDLALYEIAGSSALLARAGAVAATA
jgi:hypothetical protein